MLYLEDLNVGERFSSREYEMSLEEIQQFASMYDPQPFHLDSVLAQAHPIFKGLVASGWHTTAVTMRLLTECFPLAHGLIGSESNIRWTRPTRAGDKIHIEVEIAAITASQNYTDRAMVTCVTQAKNQNDDVLMISSTKIVVFKRNIQ